MTTIEFLSYLRSLKVKLWVDGDRLRCSAPKGVLTPTLQAELANRKSEILTFLRQTKPEARPTAPPIAPISRDQQLPLSFAQQRMWVLNQLEPGNSFYNVPVAVRLTGSLNLSALKQSLKAIIQRHEAFRTSFSTIEEQPVQLIGPELTLDWPLINLEGLSEAEREAETRRLINEEAQQPFDLAKKPLLRVKLLRLAKKEHVLLVTMHHIISDGWSMSIFVQELVALYQASVTGNPSPLPPLPIQYADFAHWQREWLQGEVLDTLLAYWKQQLAGIPPGLELPGDRPRPSIQTYQGACQTFLIPKPLTEDLKALCQQEEVTLFMLMLAAFKTLLYRYTAQEDIVVGTPIANRNRVEIEKVVGFFANTLVMRTDLSGNPSFRELLQRVRAVALEAYVHQDLPFEKLVEGLQPERDLSRNPLYQVMFILQNTPSPFLKLPDLTLSELESESTIAALDLRLELEEKLDGLRGKLEYSTDLFEPTTITRLLGHFQTLLEQIVVNPQQRLSELALLTDREQRQLLVEWNDTQVDYGQAACLHHLFEAQARQTPEATALVLPSSAGSNQQLTYQDLNQRANQLAHHLRKLGVGPEVLIGLYMERSLEMIVGLLGILKAGGAYVPLDPTYPRERVAFMLADSQAPILLTQQRLVANLPIQDPAGGKQTKAGTETSPGENQNPKVICLDADWATIAQESQENPSSVANADNPAYIIYTSGSTGRPKGVVGLHRGTVNRFRWMWQTYPFEAGEICCQKTSLSFVDAVWEIWGPLLQGIPLVLIPDEVVKDLERLLETLSDYQVTRFVLVPSLLRAILKHEEKLQSRVPRLKIWATSGEALPIELGHDFQKSMPDGVLLNIYGSSEVSADVTWHDLSQPSETASNVSIGRPMANTQVYILDPYLQPVPVGTPGEIHIGGVNLSRGYLYRPDLTAARFIPNPFSQEPGARLYKTGDLACYRPGGTIEYLGRIDHQVKVRGYRIELGEVEAALKQHPTVEQSVVVARQDLPGGARLVAYVTPNKEHNRLERPPIAGEGDQDEAGPNPQILRNFLRQHLPDYMIPSLFVSLDALPLTPNGKVNRRALPAPEILRSEPDRRFVPAQTPTEQELVQIWTEVLKVEQVSVHDNFFDLGGHSLMATQLISRVRERFAIDLAVKELFAFPTIVEMAEIVEKSILDQSSLTSIEEMLSLLEAMGEEEAQNMLTLDKERSL
jgi:amino acid adenylation domain-containing protein